MTVAPGLYRHWKGDLYRVLFTAWMSDNGLPRVEYVVYLSLVLGKINLRNLTEFVDVVDDAPRFAWVGP